MASDLETELRMALHSQADRAPISTTEFRLGPYLDSSPTRRRVWLPAVATVAAAALVVGGLMVTRRSGPGTAGNRVRPAFVHGTEVILTPAPPEK